MTSLVNNNFLPFSVNETRFIILSSDGVWDCIKKQELTENIFKILASIPQNIIKINYSEYILNKLIYGDVNLKIEGILNISIRLFGISADDITAQLILMIPNNGDILISSYSITIKNPTGNKENQDYFLSSNQGDNYLFCVCDGHGEGFSGRFSSSSVCDDLLKKFDIDVFVNELNFSSDSDVEMDLTSSNNDNKMELVEDLQSEFSKLDLSQNITNDISSLFKSLNNSLYLKFKEKLKKEIIPLNYENFPYLTYENNKILDGGTTLTLIILKKVKNNWPKILCANVGDSEAIIGNINTSNNKFNFELLTNSCSPEDPSEFDRIRKFNPSPYDSNFPKINFEIANYQSGSKANLYVKDKNGNINIQDKNIVGFYKNVNYDRATSLKFNFLNSVQGLAYTRSIGDFSLKHLGVTCQPYINLKHWN